MLSRSLDSLICTAKLLKFHSLECVSGRAPKAKVEGGLIYDDFGCFQSARNRKRINICHKKVSEE
jgi:hypothetical protein